MWQDPYGIRWAEENGVLYIQGGGKREPFLLPPFAGKDAKFLDGLLRAKEWFVENKLPFRFKGVSKAVKERMEDLCPGRYAFTPDRDNYEYIYKSEDLINLSGKKFRQKKNHLNQFRMQYSNYEYVPITEVITPIRTETACVLRFSARPQRTYLFVQALLAIKLCHLSAPPISPSPSARLRPSWVRRSGGRNFHLSHKGLSQMLRAHTLSI